MQISQRGIDLIKQFEGFRSKPYLDAAKVWTIGYGYTRGVTAATPEITEAEGERQLREAVAQDEKRLAQHLPITLSQGQYDALVSFAYNVGVEAFLRSTLFRQVCTFPDDAKRITAEFNRWTLADGKPLSGLIRRRKAEAELYCEGLNG